MRLCAMREQRQLWAGGLVREGEHGIAERGRASRAARSTARSKNGQSRRETRRSVRRRAGDRSGELGDRQLRPEVHAPPRERVGHGLAAGRRSDDQRHAGAHDPAVKVAFPQGRAPRRETDGHHSTERVATDDDAPGVAALREHRRQVLGRGPGRDVRATRLDRPVSRTSARICPTPIPKALPPALVSGPGRESTATPPRRAGWRPSRSLRR